MLSRLLSQVCPRILAPNHCASNYCAKPAKAAGRFAAAAADFLLKRGLMLPRRAQSAPDGLLDGRTRHMRICTHVLSIFTADSLLVTARIQPVYFRRSPARCCALSAAPKWSTDDQRGDDPDAFKPRLNLHRERGQGLPRGRPRLLHRPAR